MTDWWTMGVIAGLSCVTVVARSFCFIASEPWRLPHGARRGLQYAPIAALSAVVVPGDSGGAVIGSDGRVQGIIWATSRIQGGRAWATASAALGPLLEAYTRGDAPPELRCP